MVTDQKHPSDSTSNEQEVIRYTKKLAQIFGLNEQNAEVYTALSGENRALKKQLEDYHSQHNTLERRVKRLERDVKALDDYVDTDTVVDLIQEMVPLLVREKSLIKNNPSSSSSESSEESDRFPEILLGSPWMQENGVSLNMHNSTLTIDDNFAFPYQFS